MQIRDYWLIIRKRWWLILLVAGVAVGVTVGYAKLQQPTYRATVKLTVTPSRYDYGLTMVVEGLLRQYSQRFQTDKLATAVSDRLQLMLSTEKLRSKIKVSPVSEDYMLVVTIDDPDPNRARDIAYVWADEFVKDQQVLMAPVAPTDRIEVAILDKPLAGELFFPKTRQLAVAAIALGLIVGLVLAFVLEYLDDTLKSADDVERYVSLPVLGAIPGAAAADFHQMTKDRGTASGSAGRGG